MSMFCSLKQTVVMRKEPILTSKIVEMLHGHKHLVLKEQCFIQNFYIRDNYRFSSKQSKHTKIDLLR